MTRGPIVCLPLALFLAGAIACSVPEAGPALGEALFDTCAPCHGASGEGNPDLGAPAISGLPAWYIENQLRKFQEGIRGKHPEDVEGMRMRPMAVSLNHEGDVASVAGYVASLPPVIYDNAVTGNAGAGARTYAVCVPCHGPQARGTEALGAPPLASQDDWYLLAQLRKFKGGVRGADPRDTWGATMRPNALILGDQAMHDVIAYIRTLR